MFVCVGGGVFPTFGGACSVTILATSGGRIFVAECPYPSGEYIPIMTTNFNTRPLYIQLRNGKISNLRPHLYPVNRNLNKMTPRQWYGGRQLARIFPNKRQGAYHLLTPSYHNWELFKLASKAGRMRLRNNLMLRLVAVQKMRY